MYSASFFFTSSCSVSSLNLYPVCILLFLLHGRRSSGSIPSLNLYPMYILLFLVLHWRRSSGCFLTKSLSRVYPERFLPCISCCSCCRGREAAQPLHACGGRGPRQTLRCPCGHRDNASSAPGKGCLEAASLIPGGRLRNAWKPSSQRMEGASVARGSRQCNAWRPPALCLEAVCILRVDRLRNAWKPPA